MDIVAKARNSTGSLAGILMVGLLAGGLLVTGATSVRAAEDCGELPRVEWWSLNTYDSIRNHVRNAFDGDWFEYLARWNRHAARMRSIYQMGEAAVVRSRGKKLLGTELEAYIGKIERKIDVLTCLAKRDAEERQNLDLSAFATSAPGPANAIDRKRLNDLAERAERADMPIDWPRHAIEVTVLCRGGAAVFNIRNKRLRPSEPDSFTIVSGDGETVLSSRRVRLKGGESVRFAVSAEALARSGGRVVLRIGVAGGEGPAAETPAACV